MQQLTSARAGKETRGFFGGLARLSARLPVEARVLTFFGAVWGAGVAAGLPVNTPDLSSIRYIQKGYFLPLLCAAGLQILIALAAGWRRSRRRDSDPFLMLKLLPAMIVTFFLYFNLKAWMPLVNPSMYDDAYQRLDLALWPVVELLMGARSLVARHFEALTSHSIDFAYLQFYLAMFFLSPCVHGVTDTTRRQRQVVFGACLILLLGGVCYWLAPAAGPFLYREGLNLECLGAQRHMYGMFRHVAVTGEIPAGYFSSPVAAMPSLHIAHALFFTLCAARSARGLLFVYVPILLWTVVESVASGWHYLADLPAGAALAVLCLYLVTKLIPETRESDEPAAADGLADAWAGRARARAALACAVLKRRARVVALALAALFVAVALFAPFWFWYALDSVGGSWYSLTHGSAGYLVFLPLLYLARRLWAARRADASE